MAKAIKFFESPFFPALLSGLVVPGLGQIINREFKKGVLLLLASLTAFFWFSRVLTEQLSRTLPGTPDQWSRNPEAMKAAVVALVNEFPGWFVTFHLLMLVLWGFSVIDAFLTAKNLKPKSNENTDIER